MTNATKLLIATAGSLFFAGQATAAITWTLTTSPTNGAIQTIQKATLQSYSGGLGVSNADACSSGSNCDLNESNDPEHAIDNRQRHDMASASTKTFVGVKYDELVTKGWAGIGHYAGVSTSSPTTINAQGQVSSYWLIGAYNPLALNPLANPAGPTNFNPTNYDYLKLKSVISALAAPESGSVALLSAALIPLFAIRRRKPQGIEGTPA